MTNYKTPTYKPLTKGVYQLTNKKGRNKYRVRASINGVKYDEYFTNKTKALQFRKSLS